jgi:Sec-independent protein translocase protein TatA
MLHFGVLELLFILVIFVFLFGPNRIGKIAAELGKGLHNIREGFSGKVDKEE